MANPLVGGILKGIESGAAAQGNKLREDAQQARKESFAKLMQQYARDNIELQNELGINRDKQYFDMQSKRADEVYDRDRKDELSDSESSHKRALELIQAGKDGRGEMGKMYDDLVRIHGPEKAKGLIESMMTKKSGGENYAEVMDKAYDDAVKEFETELMSADTPEKKALVVKKIDARAKDLVNQRLGKGGDGGSTKALIAELLQEESKPGVMDRIKSLFGGGDEKPEMDMMSSHEQPTEPTVRSDSGSTVNTPGKQSETSNERYHNYVKSLSGGPSARETIEESLERLRSGSGNSPWAR